jgi:hypothetical protein
MVSGVRRSEMKGASVPAMASELFIAIAKL